MKWILFSLSVVIVITLLISLQDDVFLNQYKTGVFYKDLTLHRLLCSLGITLLVV